MKRCRKAEKEKIEALKLVEKDESARNTVRPPSMRTHPSPQLLENKYPSYAKLLTFLKLHLSVYQATQPRPPQAPLILLANWISFCIIVTLLA